MTHPFPTPTIAAMQRQQVKDGLLLNAERWQRAHDYHHKRQNLHYQALNQPGIVCGLGVHVIEPPEDVTSEFRDHRWVQIQPGMAIDLEGNLIIVPHVLNFRIATALKETEPVTVYLVAQYRDPTQLEDSLQAEVVQETFRIDERSCPPGPLDVELGRVLLVNQAPLVSTPADVFFPGYGELDLRYRRYAQARPQGLVRVAQINHEDDACSQNFFNLAYLLRTVENLYPALQGGEGVEQVSWDDDLRPYELLYLTGQTRLSMTSHQLSQLAYFLAAGGTLLIDAPCDAADLIQSAQILAQKLEMPLKSIREARRDHPLRTTPFLFSALPMGEQRRVQLLSGGGIILSIGNVAELWGLDEGLRRSRTALREAQELGINILHFAWKRKQMIQLHREHENCSRLKTAYSER